MTCVLCNQDMKFVNHIFVSCHYTVNISIWLLSPWPILTASLGTVSPSNIVKFFIFPQCHLKIPTNEERKFTLFASILFDKIWRIWNQTIFAGHTMNPKEGAETFKVYFDHILKRNHDLKLLFWFTNCVWNRHRPFINCMVHG